MATARDAMTLAAITIRPHATLGEALDLLLDHRISGAPVIDDDGFPVGVITEFALLDILAQPEMRQQKVAQFMTTTVLTVDENEPLDEVAARLRDFRIRRMPVLRNGRVVGIISRRDLLRFSKKTSNSSGSTVASETALVIAVVDRDPQTLQLLEELIVTALVDVVVHPFSTAADARAWLAANNCDVMLVDVDSARDEGLELLQYVKHRDPWVQVFVVTGHSSIAVVAEAMQMGATDFLRQPLDQDDVIQQLRRAAQTYRRWTSVMQSAALEV